MQHQHQQQQSGGGGGPQSLGGYGGGAAAEVVVSDEDQKLGDLGIAEAASPISSRPPAPAAIRNANFEEMIQATAEAGGSSSNRWPRQETLALLQIRSEMDTAFRDATLKGPLWEQVSRKLGELGYKRSAKKCKEKFENVHKYYKRTKEGRGGRQDGKSYKFFSQLEALHHNTAAALLPTPSPPIAATSVSLPIPAAVSLPPPDPAAAAALFGISFSSDSSSSDSEDDDDEMEETELTNQRKRKRSDQGGESDERMMDFFEGLLKQVMQKQEAMQQRFLEAIEKREQDRMIREEAWKRQDMARIAKEHEIAAQERAVSASRDAAIVDFLEKITGQTIQLPAAAPAPAPRPEPPQPPLPPTAPEMAAPLQTGTDTEKNVDIAGGSASESSSSRWPKAEVLALIKLRSSMEPRYQEAGPKGPLWEEISAGMQRIGYSRSAKRCKEKWENINKYFKKVKESNKKRPQDAKTCPYFNELDELYRKKILSGGAHVGASSEQHDEMPQRGAFPSNPFADTNIGGEKQPEDMLDKGHRQDTTGNYCNSSLRCSNSDHDLDEDNYEEVDENEEEYDDKDMKMVYELQFQRQNVGSSNPTARPSAPSSFVAMVQ
ncbi:trihelix transcription factor GTL1-like isoform X2 [Salvia miltiorrhiza]|uniref:trihelix transcription factor GTL1-like isoform X2 n=1 Tax=Salvia miltiorrhiza TaxID=226208 RepID=UPI0025ACF9A9|nr:trihelix transcription factor GTL1-like isoform X2 [Salvia miltiorrhiza]